MTIAALVCLLKRSSSRAHIPTHACLNSNSSRAQFFVSLPSKMHTQISLDPKRRCFSPQAIIYSPIKFSYNCICIAELRNNVKPLRAICATRFYLRILEISGLDDCITSVSQATDLFSGISSSPQYSTPDLIHTAINSVKGSRLESSKDSFSYKRRNNPHTSHPKLLVKGYQSDP
nr:hypothetical protein Iba_chr12aCG17510 [Ipomoea batatas]